MTKTAVPLLDLKAQYETIRDEVRAAIDRVMESQHFILGPEVETLERDVAAYSQVPHAIGVTSGTDAILVALMALGVGPGDEVITTPYTFVATCTCIARLGAKAVFVDVEPETMNVRAERVAAAITKKTKAIVPVHLFGQVAEMAPIVAAAASAKIPIVEDAAQAIGAEIDGKRAGSIGDLGCFSFFPSKNLGGAGDGGMVVSRDGDLAAKVRLLRNQGQKPKYFSVEVGGNFRLDALQAAIVGAKLPHLDGWSAARKKNADRYRQLFAEAGVAVSIDDASGGKGIAVPRELPNRRHVYNQFVIRTGRRDALRSHLAEDGIGTEIYYPQPMHLQACFSSWGHREGDFPEAERAAKESFAIPIYPELSAAQQERVVASVASFFRAAR